MKRKRHTRAGRRVEWDFDFARPLFVIVGRIVDRSIDVVLGREIVRASGDLDMKGVARSNVLVGRVKQNANLLFLPNEARFRMRSFAERNAERLMPGRAARNAKLMDGHVCACTFPARSRSTLARIVPQRAHDHTCENSNERACTSQKFRGHGAGLPSGLSANRKF